MKDFIKYATQVKPSRRQLALQEMEFYAFIHFSINTYTDHEWGNGDEDPSIFIPFAFEADQWVETCRGAGKKGLILTCKHHDGFCLWPSKYTEHSVKNSSWKNGGGDIVKEVAEACLKGGIKFGIYLSPWDRHEKTYGSPMYNEFANPNHPWDYEHRRTSIQVAELEFDGDTLTCDRDKNIPLQMCPPER